MTSDLQQLTDRIAIRDFLTTYARAVDTGNWDLYRSLFTADAHIDYTAVGGEQGDPASVAGWLESALSVFESMQHLISNEEVTFDGDTATVRAMVHSPMKLVDGPVLSCGGWYHHELVRTDAGWKSRKLTEELSWSNFGDPSSA